MGFPETYPPMNTHGSVDAILKPRTASLAGFIIRVPSLREDSLEA